MSEHVSNYFYLYFIAFLLFLIMIAVGEHVASVQIRNQLVEVCKPLPVESCEPVLLAPAIVSTQPEEVPTEEPYEQEQITKLQTDNLWCFDLKKTWEDETEPEYKKQIADLQAELETKKGLISPTECDI